MNPRESRPALQPLPLQQQLQLPADPQQNQNGSAGDGLQTHSEQQAELNQDFLDSTLGIPDTIDAGPDPYAGSQSVSGDTPAGVPGGSAAASAVASPFITAEMVQPAIGAIWSTLGNVLARAAKDECYKITAEEKKDLTEAWTPVVMFYLPRLGALGMWAPPVAVTAAIFGGKQVAAEAHRQRAANSKTPASGGSSASSASAAPANQPYSALASSLADV